MTLTWLLVLKEVRFYAPYLASSSVTMENYFKKVKRATAPSIQALPTGSHHGLQAAPPAQEPFPGQEVKSHPVAAPPRLSPVIIDCDADLAPKDVHEANIRRAMQAIVTLPAFALPVLRTVSEDSRAMLQSIPAPPVPDETHELLRHVRDVDKQGELIWCLMARSDIRTFVISKQVLQRKGFDTVQQLVLLGFLHILYHVESTCYALAMMLCHPALTPCAAATYLEQAKVWAVALEEVWNATEAFFKNKRVLRGILIEKPTVRGVNALQPDRNPSNWNRCSKIDWNMLLTDLRNGAWFQACISLADAFQGNTMSYKICLKALRAVQVECSGIRKKISYYTGKTKSYNSIHFLRCYSVATNVRCSNDEKTWILLRHMGGGVERYDYSYEQAYMAFNAISASLSPPATYYMDDLACFMCLAHD